MARTLGARVRLPVTSELQRGARVSRVTALGYSESQRRLHAGNARIPLLQLCKRRQNWNGQLLVIERLVIAVTA